MPSVWLWFSRPEKPNWFQRLIQWRQLGPWSHVRMAFDAGARGWEICESREGGVRQWFSPKPPADVAEAVELPVSEQQLAAIRGWWASHIGDGYDAVGLIELAAGRGSSDKSAWFCSEACTAALQAAGIFGFSDAARVTPQELWAMAQARKEALYFIESAHRASGR